MTDTNTTNRRDLSPLTEAECAERFQVALATKDLEHTIDVAAEMLIREARGRDSLEAAMMGPLFTLVQAVMTGDQFAMQLICLSAVRANTFLQEESEQLRALN